MPSPFQTPGSGASGCSSGSKRLCPAPLHPKSCHASKRTERDMNFKRMLDLYEAQLSIQSRSRGSGTSVTSPTLDPEREDFHRLMTLVEEAGAHEGSDEHYYASQLFMNPQCRHSFSFMRTNEGRLSWIRRTWERLREKM